MGAVALHAGVVAMADQAIPAGQLLVERHLGQRTGDGQAGRGQAPDLGWLVAGDAALRLGAAQGRVAGEAIRLQLLVAGNQLAGTHHQVGIDEGQHRQGDQVDGQDDLDDAAHIQPQNRKMLTMWPRDNTANTTKIGIWMRRHWVMASRVTASQNTA